MSPIDRLPSDSEADLASIADFINIHARQCGVDEVFDCQVSSIKSTIDRVVFKLHGVAQDAHSTVETVSTTLAQERTAFREHLKELDAILPPPYDGTSIAGRAKEEIVALREELRVAALHIDRLENQLKTSRSDREQQLIALVEESCHLAADLTRAISTVGSAADELACDLNLHKNEIDR